MTDRVHPTIECAFADFSTQLGLHGFPHPTDVVVEQFRERRTMTAHRNGAALRLVWTVQTQVLTVEVSHGPPNGPIAGWIDLYRAQLGDAGLLPDQTDFNLESATTYGLDLLGS